MFYLLPLLFLLPYSSLYGKGLVVNIQYNDNKSALDDVVLKSSLSAMEYEYIHYFVDNKMSIEEHADKVRQIIEGNSLTEKPERIILLADRMATFVGLEVISKYAGVHSLITLTGAFSDGTDFLYDNISIRKNLEMMDSLSLDGAKVKYLKTVYKMIHTKGKRVLPNNADETMKKLCSLLNSPYGASICDFSLVEHILSVKSWIGLMYDSSCDLEMQIDFMNFSTAAAKYGIRYLKPVYYDSSTIEREIMKMVVELQKN